MSPHPSRRNVLRGAVVVGVGSAVGGGALITTGVAHAEIPGPDIADCGTWGAQAPGSLDEIDSNPDKILIHHTQSANQEDTSEEAAHELARTVQSWHMDGNGWSDSGQHFTISRGGYMMEGRHTSLQHLNDGSGMVVGAHAPGQNDKSIGIENEGTYFEEEPPPELWDSMVTMCAYICQQYGIEATEIYGHMDYVATDCPGEVLYGMLPQLREDVQKALDEAA